MHWWDYIGYLAAALMFSTFYMKKMIPLRAVGASANVTFVVYAGIMHVWPLFVLHAALFPLNITRMIQMMRLVKKVREASRGEFSLDFLVPFMTKERFKKGDTVFRKGDDANKMYYLQRGDVKLTELDVYVKEGDLIGEVGVFSPNKTRMATAVCESEAFFLTIGEKQVLQLYYQNPKFGIYLVQMIIKRLLSDIDYANKGYISIKNPPWAGGKERRGVPVAAKAAEEPE
ncbi:MAG: cyclic nucleotide-binding domain-containing protein [Deltaproteobacteria bacterium]|nr:cyclic nucleotide-binding domain-containing protein [Deltaproteobacteria bacterium]